MLWINAADSVPQNEETVLVCTITKKGVKNIRTGYYTNTLGWVVGMNNNVIAWMPAPEPPEWGLEDAKQ